MAESKITREEIRGLIDKLKTKNEPALDYEGLGQLMKNSQGTSPDNMGMLMMMLMGNQKGGSNMDKFMEIQMGIAAMKAMQALNGDDNDKGIKNIIAEMQQQRQNDLKQFQELIAKRDEAEREEKRHKETLEMIAKMAESKDKDGKVDPFAALLIELVKDKEKINPLDIYDRINKNTSEQYEKMRSLEESHRSEKEAMQQQFIDRMQSYMESHSGNADTMAELNKATQTIDQFQDFAKRLGWVTPTKEGGDDKLDWRYLLNRGLDIFSNVSGAINKPKRNPAMMDYDKEANRLYKKYANRVSQPSGEDINPSWIALQLQQNPNLERDWDKALVQYERQQNTQAQSVGGQVEQPAAESSSDIEETMDVESPDVDVVSDEPMEEEVEPEDTSYYENDEPENIYGRKTEGM